MRRLPIIVDAILVIALFGCIRAAIRFPAMSKSYDAPVIGLIIALVVFNAAWLLVASRKRIARGAIATAAAGVRLKRAADAKATGIRQQIIDKANQ